MITRRSAALAALTVAAATLAAPSSHAADAPAAAATITRDEVLARTKFWFDRQVPYSQKRTYPDPQGKRYRTDSSGYASMVLKLPAPGRNTQGLADPAVTEKITKSQLQVGDLLLNKSKHVVIFAGWANAAKTRYWTYEQTPPRVKNRTVPYPYFAGNGTFEPYRYKYIR
ncbi:hypothetical protein [Streptomyces violens]|uniref:hypothetical protein n=1 Tax=Streptomyces violens TaxID=66377 RepID=UPI0004C16A68|nr:hypothetical protein [Streptomyces violens]